MIKKQVKTNNEIVPLLGNICKRKLVPRYGEPVQDGFTINDAYKLLESKNIHYSRKTVERRLDELASAGILACFMAGKEKGYTLRAKGATSACNSAMPNKSKRNQGF